jgi:hypothetical protein
MAVGIPTMQEIRRRTVPQPKNPLDVSTVVSVYPKHIKEVKPTISPGIFILEPGTPEKPTILHVESSSYWLELQEEQPLMEIVNFSTQVAESIVKDYCNGLLACNMTDTMPGLFWVPGKFTLRDLQQKQPHLLEAAIRKQHRWYEALLNLADSLWAQTNGNPLTISEDMRIAARELKQETKDWMANFLAVAQVKCHACGSLKDPNFPVCPSCRAVDMNHPAAKDLKFAN